MIYKKGKYWVSTLENPGRFTVCDRDGIARGEEIYHVGDDYATKEEAIKMVDFWAAGGHWQNRPDR